MQVPHEHGKNCIVRKAFEDLADVRDPEGPFETGANLLQAFGEGQWLLLPDFMWRGRPRPRMDFDGEGDSGRRILDCYHHKAPPQRYTGESTASFLDFPRVSLCPLWLRLCSFSEDCRAYAHTG